MKNLGSTTVDSLVTFPKGGWNHLVFTFIPNSAKLYVNGQLKLTDSNCSMGQPAVPLTLGARSDTSSKFKGNLDEFVFQNTATPWTQQQIEDLYYRGIKPTGATRYTFNDTANDDTGANALTLNGTSYSTDVPMTTRSLVPTQGLSFNGGSSYLSLGTMGNFGSQLANGFSCRFDIKTTQTTLGSILGSLNGANGMALGIQANGNNAGTTTTAGRLRVYLRASNNLLVSCEVAGTNFNDGNRHTVEVTISVNPAVVTVSVDGVSYGVTYGA